MVVLVDDLPTGYGVAYTDNRKAGPGNSTNRFGEEQAPGPRFDLDL